MYVDGFVLAVPRDNLDAYKALALRAGAVWKEHGALSVVECVGDDVPAGTVTSFPLAVQAKDSEVVVFSWIAFASRADRDRINALVMSDPRLQHDLAHMPFDGRRMIFGGFTTLIQL
jgi:uncharacterized protein YbaA (DUF1428 family)